MLQDVDKLMAEEYRETDLLLDDFHEAFPHTMTAREFAEDLPGENLAVQQAPTSAEFVEHVSHESSSSEEEPESEKEYVSDDAYEAASFVVEKYVHQKAELLWPKHVSNIFLLRHAVHRRKVEVELAAKKGQSSIMSFFM